MNEKTTASIEAGVMKTIIKIINRS